MCGRYVHPDTAAIERAWSVGRQSGNPFAARFNVVPTTPVPILRHRAHGEGFELTTARWSFVPHWWKQAKAPAMAINARSEEAGRKPMWRDAYRSGRAHCLLPALSWYEWQAREPLDPVSGEAKALKQPFALQRANKEPFCFAGLMSLWVPTETGVPVLTCAILTRAATPGVASVHDRMPVVLPSGMFDAWLDPSLESAAASAELIDQAQGDFIYYPVSTRVNNARLEGAELLQPLDLA
jgi:putative SOS response-associated peptidase YedK